LGERPFPRNQGVTEQKKREKINGGDRPTVTKKNRHQEEKGEQSAIIGEKTRMSKWNIFEELEKKKLSGVQRTSAEKLGESGE